MLVLSRRVGERVLLDVGGIHVWVRVVRLGGTQVCLGFDTTAGPDEVEIVREELLPRLATAGHDDRPDVRD